MFLGVPSRCPVGATTLAPLSFHWFKRFCSKPFGVLLRLEKYWAGMWLLLSAGLREPTGRPIARLLIREEARGDATCDGVLITLGSTDVNVIANVRQQYQIVCRIDLKRHNLPVVVRSGFAFRAVLVVHAVIHLKVLVARVGFECIRASALSRDHRAHGLGTCVDP